MSQQNNVCLDSDGMKLFSSTKWRIMNCGKRKYLYDNKKKIFFHRELLGYKGSDDIDHINGNGLDNRRVNLRICSRSANLQNIHFNRENKSSRFHGVYWHKIGKKWLAQIGQTKPGQKRKNYYLGLFDDEVIAAKAYNEKARELYGKHAKTNDV